MIGVGEALGRVLGAVPLVGAERVTLPAACGRVLAVAIRSGRDVPPFRNAAMDGYAVRTSDVARASAEHPVRLRVTETVAAGSMPARVVEPGTAIRIMTGAPVPDGTEAVVRVEDTATRGDDVDIRAAVVSGTAVRDAGEDVCRGDVVLEAGRHLRAADIGLLASLGVAVVTVARRPRVAIIATGDELVDLGVEPGPGQIVNSNAYALAAAVEEAGGEALQTGIVRDERGALRDVFAEAMRADIVLSTGGVSAGNFDYVRDVLAELGYRESFWKVAQKPGKPLTFGTCNSTPVFGLPGNPVSALVCFYVYVRAALRSMMGLRAVHLPAITACLATPLRKRRELTEFVRCVLEEGDGEVLARSTGTQSSGVLRSMSLAEGLIVVPAASETLAIGTRVRVLRLATELGSARTPV